MFGDESIYLCGGGCRYGCGCGCCGNDGCRRVAVLLLFLLDKLFGAFDLVQGHALSGTSSLADSLCMSFPLGLALLVSHRWYEGSAQIANSTLEITNSFFARIRYKRLKRHSTVSVHKKKISLNKKIIARCSASCCESANSADLSDLPPSSVLRKENWEGKQRTWHAFWCAKLNKNHGTFFFLVILRTWRNSWRYFQDWVYFRPVLSGWRNSGLNCWLAIRMPTWLPPTERCPLIDETRLPTSNMTTIEPDVFIWEKRGRQTYLRIWFAGTGDVVVVAVAMDVVAGVGVGTAADNLLEDGDVGEVGLLPCGTRVSSRFNLTSFLLERRRRQQKNNNSWSNGRSSIIVKMMKKFKLIYKTSE